MAINIDQIQNFFGEREFFEGQKLQAHQKITISFTKVRPNKYQIISGIVHENRPFQVRLTLKNEKNSGQVAGSGWDLSSNCSCPNWKEGGHCRHVAALLTHLQVNSETLQADPLPRMPLTKSAPFLNDSHGVHVSEYGTQIDGPAKLNGSRGNSTYFGLTYILTDRSTSSFSLPVPFYGVLVIHLFPQPDGWGIEEGKWWKDLARPQFSFLRPMPETAPEVGELAPRDSSHGPELREFKEVKEISLLENLYIYNWTNGESIHLHPEIREFLRTLKSQAGRPDIDDYLRMTSSLRAKGLLQITIRGQKLEDLPTIFPNPVISVAPGSRKNHFTVSLRFHSDDSESGDPAPCPQVIQVFAFTGGPLDCFNKKGQAYDFLQALVDSFEEQRPLYKKHLRGVQVKAELEAFSAYFLEQGGASSYWAQKNILCRYDLHLLRVLFRGLIQNFTPLALRYSSYSVENHNLTFEVTQQQFLAGVSEFYQAIHPYGINIFFNSKKVRNWSSTINFERKASALDWFDLKISLSDSDLKVLSHLQLGNSLSLAGENSDELVMLTDEQKQLVKFLGKYTNALKKGSTNKRTHSSDRFLVHFQKARIFEIFELQKMGLMDLLQPEEIQLCKDLMNLKQIPNYPIPQLNEGSPRPYQEVGYRWLSFLFENRLGACLADDMGLGKTLQTIMFMMAQKDKFKSILIVCPVSIILNWKNEIERFSGLTPSLYYGGDREFKNLDDMESEQAIYLTSYGIMKKEIDGVFSEQIFDCLIFDEVQHLKNLRSLGARAARRIKAKFRICLTGTPVENDLMEFFNILDLAVPGIWGDLSHFKGLPPNEARASARNVARPFILRRTKDQVLQDLPEKTENLVLLNFGRNEREQYEKNLARVRENIFQSASKKRYGEILKGLLQLRQLCLWQGAKDRPGDVLSTKISFLLENVAQILEENYQLIIFSQFTTYLDIIQHHIVKKGWKFSRIDGNQSISKRQGEVEKFQKGKNPIFLISLKAGGVGLNLTAASYIFIMDPWWNPAVENQAIDRAHRIGQKNTLTVYRPIIKQSVEEKVLELQKRKRELFDDLLADKGDEFFTGKLTVKDFEALFN